jgi:hypothetical protein
MQQIPVPILTLTLIPIVAFTRDTDTPAYGLLGYTINPNTGTIAEYKRLSQCSEGPLLQAFNVKDIGCFTQGFGEQQGTNTMLLIRHTSIPKNKKPSFQQVVCHYKPESKSMANPMNSSWRLHLLCS